MTLALYDFQREVVDLLRQNIGQTQRQLVSLPTGSGKTVVFSRFISEAKQHHNVKKTLVLAHRDELIAQAVAKLQLMAPELSIGVVKGWRNETEADVIVASVQTLARRARLQQLDPDDFQLIVVDEAHHAYAPSYLRILGYLGGFQRDGTTHVVGFTATAQRQGLDKVFDLVYHKDLRELIAAGYLVPLEYVQVKTEVDLGLLQLWGDDLAVGKLAEAINTPARNALVVATYLGHAQGERAVAFTANVQHAHDLCMSFREVDVNAAYLHAGTPTKQREEILANLREGSIDVICNCGILTEGWDDPSVSTIIMARPTLSNILYTQMVGRGLRTSPGKERCQVLDMVDNIQHHNLVSLPFLLPEFASKKLIKGVSTRVKEPREDEEGEIVSAFTTTEEESDPFTSKLDISWQVEGTDLLYVPTPRLQLRLAARQGWYYIEITRLHRLTPRTIVLNKAPILTLTKAKELAIAYLEKTGLIKAPKASKSHKDNPKCQELCSLLTQVDPTLPTLTQTERELLVEFTGAGEYQINKTARILGCTHTNVWQRLYGGRASDVGGILKKLRLLKG